MGALWDPIDTPDLAEPTGLLPYRPRHAASPQGFRLPMLMGRRLRGRGRQSRGGRRHQLPRMRLAMWTR
jgi:hypothetical protein